jgi:hypothetical protein
VKEWANFKEEGDKVKVKTLAILALVIGLNTSMGFAQGLPPTRVVPASPAWGSYGWKPPGWQPITCANLADYCFHWESMYLNVSRTLCDSKHGLEPCPSPTKNGLDGSTDSIPGLAPEGLRADFYKSQGPEALQIYHNASNVLWTYDPFDPRIARDACMAVCQQNPTDGGVGGLKEYLDQNYGNNNIN